MWHHCQDTWSDLLATCTTLCSELLQKEEAMNAELERLNSALLTTLSQATGNILDNRELLSTLDATKAAAVDISGALAESVRLQVCLGSIQYVFKHIYIYMYTYICMFPCLAFCTSHMSHQLRDFVRMGNMPSRTNIKFGKLQHLCCLPIVLGQAIVV